MTRVFFGVALLAACGTSPVEFAAPKKAVTAVRHQAFAQLLATYVAPTGGVNYQRWHDTPADVETLDHYLGQLAQASPETSPELFAEPGSKLSYWINLYNSIVIREVLRRWPLESVRDVSPTLTSKIVRGKGFFRDLTFAIGGKNLSLDDIENEILRRQFDDARVHFALNCGSASCPVMQPDTFEPGDLDKQLHAVTVAFVGDPENVFFDEHNKLVRLSKIFDWYGDDFALHARKHGYGSSVLGFIKHHAGAELAKNLDRAIAGKYKIKFYDYDWSVNSDRKLPPEPARASDNFRLPLLGGDTFDSARQSGVIVLDFWATWCRPCTATLPKLAALAAKHPDWSVVAVSIDAEDSDVSEFLSKLDLGAALKIGRDPEQSLMTTLAVRSVPTLVIIENGRSRIVSSFAEVANL